jgi:hypothetical protein
VTLSHIQSKIDELFEQLTAEGYAGHDDRVRNLVVGCRIALSRGTGEVGPWEAWQLDFAERAVDANFLRLGLIAVQNALAVSRLASEEYEYGVRQASSGNTSGTATRHSAAHMSWGEDINFGVLYASKRTR